MTVLTLGLARHQASEVKQVDSWSREEVSRLPTSAVEYYRYGTHPAPPRLPPHEVSGIFPVEHRMVYDVRQVRSAGFHNLDSQKWPFSSPVFVHSFIMID